MARRSNIPDADQPEFSFGLELPSNETVNEGPVASIATPPVSNVPAAGPAPATEKPNRKQRRAATKQKPVAEAPAPVAEPVVEAPKAVEAPKPVEPPRPVEAPKAVAAPQPVEAPKAVPAAPKMKIRPADAKQPTPFETLLHNELGRVFNFCLRLTQDAALADDLTQDVFVAAAKDLPEATSEAPAPHRLTRDAIDLFCRGRRYNRPRKALVEAEAPSPSAQPQPPVYNLPAAWDGLPDDHRAFLAALGTLDAEDRVILVLKDVEGRSYADAGEILEMGESSLRSRVASARERLHAAVRKISEQKKP